MGKEERVYCCPITNPTFILLSPGGPRASPVQPARAEGHPAGEKLTKGARQRLGGRARRLPAEATDVSDGSALCSFRSFLLPFIYPFLWD